QAAVRMAKTQYMPTVAEFTGQLAQTVASLKAAGAASETQKEHLDKVSGLLKSAAKKLGALETALAKAQEISDAEKKAEAYRDHVVPAMNALRADIDTLETLTPAKLWPVPSYAEMLFKF